VPVVVKPGLPPALSTIEELGDGSFLFLNRSVLPYRDCDQLLTEFSSVQVPLRAKPASLSSMTRLTGSVPVALRVR
jgi:hypothetical protein